MKTRYTNIRVLVGRSIEAVDNRECDDVKNCDTIKEAKEFARYAVTDAYQQIIEASEPMGYARVMAWQDGRDICVYDRFRK